MGQHIYGEDGRFLGEVLCWEDGLSSEIRGEEGEDLGPCDPADDAGPFAEDDRLSEAMAAFAALDDFDTFLPGDGPATAEDVAWWSEWSSREDAA